MAGRQLKIKAGSVIRLSKELGMYAEEQRAESAKVAGMRADNADSHDIQHAVSSGYAMPLCPLATDTQARWCCQGPRRFRSGIVEQMTCTQENVLAEAAMMIPDTRQRLEKALHELQSTLVRGGCLSALQP